MNGFKMLFIQGDLLEPDGNLKVTQHHLLYPKS